MSIGLFAPMQSFSVGSSTERKLIIQLLKHQTSNTKCCYLKLGFDSFFESEFDLNLFVVTEAEKIIFIY